MIKVIPIVIAIVVVIVLTAEYIVVPLYKHISNRIKTTKKEINKIK